LSKLDLQNLPYPSKQREKTKKTRIHKETQASGSNDKISQKPNSFSSQSERGRIAGELSDLSLFGVMVWRKILVALCAKNSNPTEIDLQRWLVPNSLWKVY
jgi:hypothetical protein